MEIFGIPIDASPKREILGSISAALDAGNACRIATVNPEYLLEARKNERFRKNLAKADLLVADGFGIQLMAFLRGCRLARIPGADLMLDILKMAEGKNLPVFLALKEDGLSSPEEIRNSLEKIYPHLLISQDISAASVVLCNFGAPYQEFFLESAGGNGIRMGVGGAFDYLTGRLPRAPRWMRSIGLEWFWRLFLQPKRIKRIWNAVIVFPILAISDTIRK